jgi:Nucleotidyl transferase AbiEii toxin, Type IV TA system
VSARSPEDAYRALQKLARADGRTTQQTFELYVHERFLARLASSRFAERLVLKGGMLLAVLDARRATRDADMLARGIDNDMENLRSVVSEIAAIELADGVVFDVSGVSLVAIREDADYDGVRAAVPASLGSAVLKLRLDLSFGDPVDPQRIDYPTLLDDPVFSLLGYPLESVIAEKAETMMALGDANSRDRDYGDIYVLSGIYPLEREPVWEALLAVAQHRGREVRPLGPLLMTLRESRQQPWAAFRARVGLPGLPERFSDVVDGVVEFIDGLQADDVSHWNPTQRRWE